MNQYIISLFLLLLQTSTSTTTHPDIVQNTCETCASNDTNVNYAQCIDSFNSTPKSHHEDLNGLGVIATKIAKANARNITIVIKTLLKCDKQMSPYKKSCLDTCLEVYEDAIEGLKDSAKAIRTGHYDDANMMLSSVLDASETCEDGFTEGPIESPLTKENDDFFGHSVVALCITAMLQGLGGRRNYEN